MKQKIKQILYDMRHQPVIAWVTFIATAMTVFMIIVVEIATHVTVVPFAPESCRERLLLGAYIHKERIGGNTDWVIHASGMSYPVARTLYENLDGVERTSFLEKETTKDDVRGTTGRVFAADRRRVDSEFFGIFDHQLIAGRFFTADESASLAPVVVISERTARRAFGSIDCIGQELSVDWRKYQVVGVVKDSSPLARTAWADVFVVTGPLDPAMSREVGEGETQLFGHVTAALLVREGVDFQSVRNQVKARYAIIDTWLAPDGFRTVYHGSPFDREVIGTGQVGPNWSNTGSPRILAYILYVIALIVPAINLGGMLNSRMRRRLSEIGLRRAFGCTRARIFTDIIVENFIVTLVGGLVGLVLGIIVAKSCSWLYELPENFGESISPDLSAVINWDTVIVAFALCFVLNIFSACVPAWRASRLKPVNAINAR